MKNKNILWNNETIIIWNNKKDLITSLDVLESNIFHTVTKNFLSNLKQTNKYLWNWLNDNKQTNDINYELISVFKELYKNNKINHKFLQQPFILNTILESFYHWWRKKQRFSMLDYEINGVENHKIFIDADNSFNTAILNTYRVIQENLQGDENHVYRELNSGSNGSFFVRNFNWKIPKEYQAVKNIKFINKILLRTPMIISTKNNKRKGMFTSTNISPFSNFKINDSEWFCLPLKVGRNLFFFYFNYKHLANALALANLFKIAASEDCIDVKPDAIVLFGVDDNQNDTTYYHDKLNDIWIGKVSDNEDIDYFGYNKKMILTLFNLINMNKGYLPIHGSMIKLFFKNKQQKNIIFMGDSGTGKSETIEALTKIGINELSHYDVIFDDMGYIKIDNNGEIVGSGSEIGAFIRLDDLDQSIIYADMDRAIYFNPECVNARVVIPISKYETIIKEHKVDLFLYANNYTDLRGIEKFDNIDQAIEVFVNGKRQSMQTTQETGISTTFFANPFGPMQEKEKCIDLIRDYFKQMYKNKIYVGQIYTCLGLENSSQSLLESVKKLLLVLKQ